MSEGFFSKVAAAAESLTYSEARATVPMLWVLEQFEIEYRETGSGYSLLCPVHQETKPSCNIFGEHLEVFNCFSCGANGDVTELVCQLQGTKPAKALQWLAENLESAKAWNGPREGVERPTIDLVAAQADVVSASQGGFDLIDELIADRGWSFDGQWLRDTFGVGEDGSNIVIPYFGTDGSLVTYKTRTPTTKPYSLTGSDFKDTLYNAAALQGNKPVLLTGSESDTWSSQWYHGVEYAVVGAPTGETARPRQAHLLGGRTVYCCFDGDDAGDLGTAKWTDALTREGCQVFIVRLPRGEDCAGIGDLTSYLAEATEATSAYPDGLHITPTGYWADKKDGKREVSNWVFEPHYVAEGEQGQAFSGVIMPGERKATIQSADFSGRGSITQWASVHHRAWYGDARDAQMLLGAFQSMRSHLVKARSVSTVGLHGSSFVWPKGSVGPGGVVFAAPFQSVDYDIKAEPGRWSAQQVADMVGMMKREVTTPILAWLMISQLRELYPSFPILAGFGTSGSGKTTAFEIMVPAITGSHTKRTLTLTTEHGIGATLGGENAFAVFIDELREDTRPETFERFLQMLRDIYDGKGGTKGNNGNWASTGTTYLKAPLVIAGETGLSETSHLERLVYIPFQRSDPILGALDPIHDWAGKYDEGALAYAILEYLSGTLQSGRFEPSRVPLIGSGFHPRIQHNLGLLHTGWWLLRDFCGEQGIDIGELDLTRVMAKLNSQPKSPILEAIKWCSGKPEAGVREVSGIIVVDIPVFLRTARSGGFAIPGNIQAVRDLLVNEYGAEPEGSSMFIVKFDSSEI